MLPPTNTDAILRRLLAQDARDPPAALWGRQGLSGRSSYLVQLQYSLGVAGYSIAGSPQTWGAASQPADRRATLMTVIHISRRGLGLGMREVTSYLSPSARTMVWPTSPGAMACSWCVSWFLDAPAGQEASVSVSLGPSVRP